MFKPTWKQRAFIGFASAFESYNIVVYVALQAYLNHHFFPEAAFGVQANLLIWLPFILRFLAGPAGGLIIGYYAERHGRKAALVLSSWIIGLATLMMACLPTFASISYWAPALLFFMQILQSFSYSGEYPTTVVYLMETAEDQEKVRCSAVLVAFNILIVGLSWLVTATCTAYLTEAEMLAYGWRIPLLLGALNIYVGYLIRCKLLESPTFKSSTRHTFDPMIGLRLLCIFAPCSILFFSTNVATQTLIEQLTPDPVLQTSLPIIWSLLCCVSCLAAGWWMDKTDTCSSLLRKTYFWMTLLAVPAYGLQSLDSVPALILSLLLILITVGISMAGTIPEMYRYVGHHNKVIVMGLAFSMGGILFGSMTPLLTNLLANYGQAYVGLLMSVGGLFYFVSVWMGQKQLQPVADKTSM